MKLGDMQQTPRHLINGRWEIGTTTGVSVNPSDTREVVAEYARADRNQAGQAVRAAADALRHWSRSAPQRRADVLDLVGSELLARKEELGTLLAREEGKPLPEAVAEVVRSGHIFKFFAGEALRIPTRMLQQSEMIGVVGADVAHYYAAHGIVTVLPIAMPCHMDAFGIVTRTDRLLSPAAKVMMKALKQTSLVQYGRKLEMDE
ncbi:aldehyde dehydrogenase family protein [Paracidovorax citrulli]